jgi:hypothetical protein
MAGKSKSSVSSARARRPKPVQPAQLVLFKARGGKRRGAGRPPKGQRAGSPHKERPYLQARYPVHIVLRVISAVGNLRRRCVYQAIREATLTTARREDLDDRLVLERGDVPRLDGVRRGGVSVARSPNL